MMTLQGNDIDGQRLRALMHRHEDSRRSFLSKQPARPQARSNPITYGKKTRLLSLTGKQFRPNIYDLPLEDDERDERHDARFRAATHCGPHVPREDSPLSDEGSYSSEPEVERSSATQSRHFPNASTKMGMLHAALTGRRLKDARSGHRSNDATELTSKPVAPAIQRIRLDRAPVGTRKTSHSPIVGRKVKSSARNAPQHVEDGRYRRIPEPGQLICVASFPEAENITADPLSSPRGVAKQDPISDSSSMQPRDPLSSPPDVARGRKTGRSPLTAIRRRLTMPNYKHKVVKLKKSKPRPLWAPGPSSILSGDGFEGSELTITHRHRARKQQRSARRAPRALVFAPLQMQAGPLPDVSFKSIDGERVQVQDCPPERASRGQKIKDEATSGASKPTSQNLRRQVSFSDREDIIMAQLSSVSAPRMNVDSDDESAQEDVEEEDAISENGVEEEQDGDGDDDDDDTGGEASKTEFEETIAVVSSPASGSAHDDGCDLEQSDDDFDAPASQSRSSRARLDRLRRPQVDEFIVDNPGQEGVALDFCRLSHPGTLPRSSLLLKRRLMELHEPIDDIPSTRSTVHPGDDSASTYGEADKPTIRSSRQPPKRLRSILKKNTITTEIAPQSSFREHTAANTRRNSQRTAMIELTNDDEESSSYFASASQSLSAINPRRHTIVPRRKSSYFSEQPFEVYVPDSDRPIPETSQALPAYANTCQLRISRQNSQAIWTSSQKLPSAREAPKDLRMLTRTVSREHGTLSQSVRRRPSLRFKSPRKVR